MKGFHIVCLNVRIFFKAMADAGNKYFESEDDDVLSAEILEFAGEYQSRDFPNPERRDCPSKDELLKTADSGELPEGDFLRHLLSCSPCFVEFNVARQAKNAAPAPSRQIKTSRGSFGFSFFLKPFPAFALLLLAGVSAGLIFYALAPATSPEIAQLQSPSPHERIEQAAPEAPHAVNPATANNLPTATAPAPLKPADQPANLKNNSPKTKAEPKATEPTTFDLDLTKNAVLRNNGSSETVYSLPSRNITLDMKLPVDSAAGDYEVTLRDEFGKTLHALNADSDGKSLKVRLNLQNKRGRARLCVAPKGEIPDCLAVSIERTE